MKIRGGTLVGSNWYCGQECAQKDNPEVDEAYEDEDEEEEVDDDQQIHQKENTEEQQNEQKVEELPEETVEC